MILLIDLKLAIIIQLIIYLGNYSIIAQQLINVSKINVVELFITCAILNSYENIGNYLSSNSVFIYLGLIDFFNVETINSFKSNNGPPYMILNLF